MKNKTLFNKTITVFLSLSGFIISFCFFSCSKSNPVNPVNDGIKHYRILVTWTGNRANLVPGPPGPPNYENPNQEVSASFSESDGNGLWCCMFDPRDSSSSAEVGYTNEDFLKYDSLWSYTQDVVDSIHIGVFNDGIQPVTPLAPPAVTIRVRIFPQNSQKTLLDSSFVLTNYFGPIFPYKSFEFYPPK